jgi:hypothetical protein
LAGVWPVFEPGFRKTRRDGLAGYPHAGWNERVDAPLSGVKHFAPHALRRWCDSLHASPESPIKNQDQIRKKPSFALPEAFEPSSAVWPKICGCQERSIDPLMPQIIHQKASNRMSLRHIFSRFFAVACLAVVAVAFEPHARGETIFTNLPGQPGTIASNLPVGATGADWTYGGQQFNSGSNTLITDVSLLLARGAGTVTGTYDVEIWTDSSNKPGSLLGAIATGQDPNGVSLAGPQLMSYSAASVSVFANTDYWVVMNMSNNASQLQWQYTNASTSSAGFIGVTGTELLQSADPPAPLSWATPAGITQGHLMMSVTAVPEPASVGLMAFGAAGLGIMALRRMRRG